MSITEIRELFIDAGLLDTVQEEDFNIEEVIEVVKNRYRICILK